MSTLPLILWTLLAACAAFAVLFVVARRIDNFGVVDVLWAAGFAPAALGYGLLAGGWAPRRLTVTALAVAWSTRLGLHLARRVLGHLDTEDGRYQALRRDWAASLGTRMFVFFQAQAVILVGFSCPFLLACANRFASFTAVELAGFALVVLAVAGEGLADRQLAAFKRDPANRGRVCDRGLWSWSRHPNYFFEWLVWVGFALIAWPAPHGAAALACPVVMLYLLTRVTGIRYTEEQLLRSKGDAYRAYQARTSAFLPLPPRPHHP